MEAQTVILVVLLVACGHIQTGKCGVVVRIYFMDNNYDASILQQNRSLDIASSRGLASSVHTLAVDC